MEVTATVETPYPPEAVWVWVEDLALYPSWLEFVKRAQPDGDGTWLVDLRGRIGPLARSKRLRMARTEVVPNRSVRFERAEVDERDHSPWVLSASIEPTGEGSVLTYTLRYGGGLFGPVLERVLDHEIEKARGRLLACLADDH